MAGRIPEPAEMEPLCIKWHIAKLALFGSYLRSDFSSESDVDLIASFSKDAQWSLLDHQRMKKDFEHFFSRKVDLLSESALNRMKNQNRRQEITANMKVIYAA
jgi:uncharacterized protein